MRRLMVNKDILSVLKKAKPCLRKALLKNVTPEIINTLSEICLNTVNGNNKICNATIKKLKRYKNSIRSVSQPKRSVASRRKILVQNGGFLPVLIGTILSGVVGALIDKYAK